MIGILPLGTEVEPKGIPTATLKFILACCLVHVITWLIKLNSPESLNSWFSFNGFWWFLPFTALSCIFVHSDFQHLFFNMLFFFVFAAPIELAEGKRKFWLMVLFGALFSGYFSAAITWFFSEWIIPIDTNMAVRRYWQLHGSGGIGSSGMISAFVTAYLVRFWRNRVYTVLNIEGWPIPKLFRMPAWIVVLVFEVLFNLYNGICYQGLLAMGHIGHFAHLGGFLAGFILAFYFGYHKHQKRDYYVQHAEDLAKSPFTGSAAAIKTYLQALRYEPGNGRILLEIARCSYYLEDFAQSREYYKQAMLALSRQNEEALLAKTCSEAFSRHQLLFNSGKQLECIRLMLKHGDWQTAQKAVEFFCRKVSDQGKDLSLYIRGKFILAYILDAYAGKQLAAREEVERLLEDFPGHPALKYAGERLAAARDGAQLFNFAPTHPGYPFELGSARTAQSPERSQTALPWYKVRPRFMLKFGLGVILSPLAFIILYWLWSNLLIITSGIFGFALFPS
jgi:membrane associated rhomboid family serine protease